MGLTEGDPGHRRLDNIRAWWLPGSIAVVALLIAALGDQGREWFRYDRVAIEGGELWRLASGHFAHLGLSHLALNIAGLLLIAYLVIAQFRPWQWVVVTIVVLLGIDLGFWFFEPQLVWYVGLSGLLHGIWAAGAISGLRTGLIDYRLLLGFLVLKLGYEQFAGPLPGSEESTGGNVVVASHLYGALSGALIGGWLSLRKAHASPI